MDRTTDCCGLFGMLWCHDWYLEGASLPDAVDPFGPADGWARMSRGGCWFCEVEDHRVALRGWDGPSFQGDSIGFHPVRTLD